MNNYEYQVKAMRTKPANFECLFGPTQLHRICVFMEHSGKYASQLQKTFQGHIPEYPISDVAIEKLGAPVIDHIPFPGQLIHAVTGICGEAGEIADLFAEVLTGDKESLDPEHLKKELGDLMWFIAEACDALDASIDEIQAMNIAKLDKRYPKGFEAERSLHREEGDI